MQLQTLLLGFAGYLVRESSGISPGGLSLVFTSSPASASLSATVVVQEGQQSHLKGQPQVRLTALEKTPLHLVVKGELSLVEQGRRAAGERAVS